MIEESKKEDDLPKMINTSSAKSKAAGKSDLLLQYTLGQIGESRARKNKNRTYYEEHMKAMEL